MGWTPLSVSAVIQAAIDHQPVKPRLKLRLAAELPDLGQQLKKRFLRDVQGHGRVARKPQGDGINPVPMGLKQGGEGVLLAPLAGARRSLAGFVSISSAPPI